MTTFTLFFLFDHPLRYSLSQPLSLISLISYLPLFSLFFLFFTISMHHRRLPSAWILAKCHLVKLLTNHLARPPSATSIRAEMRKNEPLKMLISHANFLLICCCMSSLGFTANAWGSRGLNPFEPKPTPVKTRCWWTIDRQMKNDHELLTILVPILIFGHFPNERRSLWVLGG